MADGLIGYHGNLLAAGDDHVAGREVFGFGVLATRRVPRSVGFRFKSGMTGLVCHNCFH